MKEDIILTEEEKASILANRALAKGQSLKHEIDKGFISHFFKRQGRLNRKRYVKRYLLVSLLELFLMTVLASLVALYQYGYESLPILLGEFIMTLPFGYAIFCLSCRRLQDLGQGPYLGGFLWILELVSFWSNQYSDLLSTALAIVQIVIVFYLWGTPGIRGRNEYGPDPLDI